jgi:hypothetical protein
MAKKSLPPFLLPSQRSRPISTATIADATAPLTSPALPLIRSAALFDVDADDELDEDTVFPGPSLTAAPAWI